MTTSTYLALALMDQIFTVSDLASYGLRSVLKIGERSITYTPRADQPLSLERTIEAFADKPTPANDNEPLEEASPAAAPGPAVALTQSAALVLFMQELRNTPTAPRWAREMAVDWLKNSSQPGADFRGQRILNQLGVLRMAVFQRMSKQAVALLQPQMGRAGLKIQHSQLPIRDRIEFAGRPVMEEWMAQHQRRKLTKDAAA